MQTKNIKNLIIGLIAGATFATSAFAQNATTNSSSITSNLLAQLTASSSTNSDATLQSLSTNLTAKVAALSASLTNQPAAQAQLQSGLQGLLSGTNSAQSLGAFQKLSSSKLTPEQTALAKQVRDVGAAYLVQKNFSSVNSSQGDVAQIVTSLSKGDVVTALPAVQKVSQNAQLTTDQKDLLTGVADAYAPGVKKASDMLKGLKGLSIFGK